MFIHLDDSEQYMWIKMRWQLSPKILWKSHKVSRAWKKQQSNCTKLCRQGGIQVCGRLSTKFSMLSHCTHSDMAATMERLQEYRTYNSQFCKRVFDFLSIMIVAQVNTTKTAFLNSIYSTHVLTRIRSPRCFSEIPQV